MCFLALHIKHRRVQIWTTRKTHCTYWKHFTYISYSSGRHCVPVCVHAAQRLRADWTVQSEAADHGTVRSAAEAHDVNGGVAGFSAGTGRLVFEFSNWIFLSLDYSTTRSFHWIILHCTYYLSDVIRPLYKWGTGQSTFIMVSEMHCILILFFWTVVTVITKIYHPSNKIYMNNGHHRLAWLTQS